MRLRRLVRSVRFKAENREENKIGELGGKIRSPICPSAFSSRKSVEKSVDIPIKSILFPQNQFVNYCVYGKKGEAVAYT